MRGAWGIVRVRVAIFVADSVIFSRYSKVNPPLCDRTVFPMFKEALLLASSTTVNE